MDTVKQFSFSGVLGSLLGRRNPPSSPGPIAPAYGRPQQALLPQNRLNQPQPGMGQVGSPFGSTVGKEDLVRYWRAIEPTINQMVTKAIARRGFWFEFTINVTDQDYLTYMIGGNIQATGNGLIILREFLVENGRHTQERRLQPIRVTGWIYSQSDMNSIMTVIARRYAILMLNAREGIDFRVNSSLNSSNQMAGVPSGASAIDPRSPKTLVNISAQTIRDNIIESLAKITNTNLLKNEFTINATDQNYIRYKFLIHRKAVT